MIGLCMMGRLDMRDFDGKKFDFSVIFLYNIYTKVREKSLTICPRSPIGRDRGLKIPPVWVRVPSRVPLIKANVVDANIGGVRYAQNPREGGCAEAASMAVGLLQHLHRVKR